MGHALWKLFDSATPLGVLVIYMAVPILVVWGWFRWMKGRMPDSVLGKLSYAGFGLATLSGLLAVGAMAYAQRTGGLAYYEPTFTTVFRWGFGISAAAILLALAGMAHRSPLRWHATLCALGMLFYWATALFE